MPFLNELFKDFNKRKAVSSNVFYLHPVRFHKPNRHCLQASIGPIVTSAGQKPL